MAALPALVLAMLAATGGCSLVCPADELPEVPDPGEPRDAAPDLEEAKELAPREPVPVDPAIASDPLSLLDEITRAQLPADDDPLTPAKTSSPIVDAPEPRDAPKEIEHADDRDPAPSEHHAARGSEASPQAQGQAAHEPHTWPTTNGEQVDDAGASLAASLLLGLAGVGLYHKLSKDRALEHPARQQILSMLETEPGLGTTDVADRLDVCYRTARHHLEVLARFDLVVQAKQRGSWRWARPENAQAVREPEVPEIQQRMLALLEEDPGLHLSEIARRLDAAKATVKHHLDRLDERDVVQDERVGPLRRFFPVSSR